MNKELKLWCDRCADKVSDEEAKEYLNKFHSENANNQDDMLSKPFVYHNVGQAALCTECLRETYKSKRLMFWCDSCIENYADKQISALWKKLFCSEDSEYRAYEVKKGTGVWDGDRFMCKPCFAESTSSE